MGTPTLPGRSSNLGVMAVAGFGAAERLTPAPGDCVTVIELLETEKQNGG